MLRKKSALVLIIMIAIVCCVPSAAAARYDLSALSDSDLLSLYQSLLEEADVRGIDITDANSTTASTKQEAMVWVPKSGKKYYSKSTCSNMKNPSEVTLSMAKKLGYGACSKCNPPK